MSLAHSEEDIQRTIDAARRCFAKPYFIWLLRRSG
jgi:glutamate-1-semialdehyde aminotransferase